MDRTFELEMDGENVTVTFHEEMDSRIFIERLLEPTITFIRISPDHDKIKFHAVNKKRISRVREV